MREFQSEAFSGTWYQLLAISATEVTDSRTTGEIFSVHPADTGLARRSFLLGPVYFSFLFPSPLHPFLLHLELCCLGLDNALWRKNACTVHPFSSLSPSCFVLLLLLPFILLVSFSFMYPTVQQPTYTKFHGSGNSSGEFNCWAFVTGL